MVEVLSLVLHQDQQAVLCAVELALQSGVVSKEQVLNLLHRLLAADAPPPGEIPARPTLREEPYAKVHRRGSVPLAGPREPGLEAEPMTPRLPQHRAQVRYFRDVRH